MQLGRLGRIGPPVLATAVLATAMIAATVVLAEMPTGREHVNSVGMRLARIEAGSFQMGIGATPLPDDVVEKRFLKAGDFDERPAHPVTIGAPFYLGTTEVTNAQYERFDPTHRSLRGKLGFSTKDNEAAVFVSWQEARDYCRWLSKKEGLPYRLPTEAEWEYACRAGTTTYYHTGDTLPEAFQKNVRTSWFPDDVRTKEGEIVPLTVGKTPANPWGLLDMHGNVEEWCHDWYGPYAKGAQTDPVGRIDGDFRVTRGGSHSTLLYYLRSANRSGTVPEERSWVIGFRVALGESPNSKPLPVPPPPRHQTDVVQTVPADVKKGPDPTKPYFEGPKPYVKIPEGAEGPMFSHHNHDPAIVECPNGDLLAIWYSCVEEPGRELTLLASRLRYGAKEWEEAAPFWDAPDRNDHAPNMWFDGERTIYQFVGLSAAATWGNLATVMRTSTDNGATWSPARLIVTEHGTRHMPIESSFRLSSGTLAVPCDAVTGGNGGSALWLSDDLGRTWSDSGGTIAGIHAGVTQLTDGRLLAFGRGDSIDGKMPQSLSRDRGATWERSASGFTPIGGGQRLVLTRLQEGPLLFISFANDPMPITDASGKQRPVKGLFAALSYDDGETWPVRRLVSDDGPGREVEAMDGHTFQMSAEQGEPRGYMSICQHLNGVIHLISSRQHYAFNLAWLETPPPEIRKP